MADKPPFEQALLGQTLAGKYRLVEVQGAGFYSVVFVANQHFCNRFVRKVALKVSRQTGLDEDTAPGIFGDALVLAQLLANSDHDGRRHLVQIHDMGLLPEHDGRAYLVMEYVDGLPLMSHMAQGRFPAAAGLRVFKQICQALALVHEQGAIHRDLIPENILVDRKGAIRVVDFGLAAYADPRYGFAPGAAGTFCYMAPETLQGRSTAASDVYSIGLVVYQLFTGGGPHLTAPWVTEERASQAEDNLRIKTALHFVPVSDFHNEVRNEHRWLDELLARCLRTDSAGRFANAAQLLAALEACEAGLPVPEAPPAAPPPDETAPPAAPRGRSDEEMEALFREARRLLASRAYEKVIDRLDIHRPAEWAVLDYNGARALRMLGQAFLGRGELREARECLEQLRNAQREHAVLAKPDYAAALSDLHRCYRGLGLAELAQACQEEARGLM